jgi:hypothetical protein
MRRTRGPQDVGRREEGYLFNKADGDSVEDRKVDRKVRKVLSSFMREGR